MGGLRGEYQERTDKSTCLPQVKQLSSQLSAASSVVVVHVLGLDPVGEKCHTDGST